MVIYLVFIIQQCLFSGNLLPTQLIPIPQAILDLPGREGNATVELIIFARNIPPLGFKSLFVEKKDGNDVLEVVFTDDHRFGVSQLFFHYFSN